MAQGVTRRSFRPAERTHGRRYGALHRLHGHGAALRPRIHHGQVSQERLNLGRPHGVGVANAVEANEPFDPIDVDLLGSIGKVLGTYRMTNSIEKFYGLLHPIQLCLPAKSCVR